MTAAETDEVILLTQAVEQSYGVAGVTLRCLARGGKSVYQVTRPDGPDWILRAYRLNNAEADNDDSQRLAGILQFLQGHSYVTECVIEAADGSQTAALRNCRLLMTTYLGQALCSWQSATAGAANAPAFEYAPKTLYSFGEALSRLHALRVEEAQLPQRGCCLPQSLPGRRSVCAGAPRFPASTKRNIIS